MNISNLQVKIKRIKIKTRPGAQIAFSLRLGNKLSAMTPAVPQPGPHSDSQQVDLQLTLACEDSFLSGDTRACLVMYQLTEQEEKEIVGMVFIALRSSQGIMQQYSIQQSQDPSSFVELSFAVLNLEVKQPENESVGSKSSLAEIKELHRALSKHRRSASDYSFEPDQLHRLASNIDSKKQPKLKNGNRVLHIKSEESAQSGGHEEDPSYAILLRKAENQLAKERERNSVLTNLLVIEEAKNEQSHRLINNIIKKIKGMPCSPVKKRNTHDLINLFKNELNDMRQEGKAENDEKFELMARERDELYALSQELYSKTRMLKAENDSLYANSKTLESQLERTLRENEDMREQIIYFRTAMHTKTSSSAAEQAQIQSKNMELQQEIQRLRELNKEMERKFKQTFRAVESYKNDAWRAEEQLILKDLEIAKLKQTLEKSRNNTSNFKDNSRQLPSVDRSHQDRLAPSQIIKILQNLVVSNQQQCEKKLQKLGKIRSHPSTSLENKQHLKSLIDSFFLQLLAEPRPKPVSITQIKGRLMSILNSQFF